MRQPRNYGQLRDTQVEVGKARAAQAERAGRGSGSQLDFGDQDKVDAVFAAYAESLGEQQKKGLVNDVGNRLEKFHQGDAKIVGDALKVFEVKEAKQAAADVKDREAAEQGKQRTNDGREME